MLPEDAYLYKGDLIDSNVILREGEPTSPAKWWLNNDNPTLRKILPVAAFAVSFFFVPPPIQAEIVTVDKWYQPLSEPIRKIPIVQQGGETRVDVVVAAENITLDKWYQPFSEPVRIKRVLQPDGEFKFEIPRTILLSDWFQAASEPVRRKTWQNNGGEVRIDIIPQTIDEWGQPTNQPYFLKRRDPNTGEFKFEVPRTILISDWFQQASEPVRTKVRQLFGGEFRTEVVTAAELITIDKWLSRYPDYFTARTIQQPSGETSLILRIENITLDKWFKEVVQPYYSRRRDSNTGEVQVINPDLFPPPPVITPAGASPVQISRPGGRNIHYEDPDELRNRILQDDDEILLFIKIWLQCKE